MNKVTVKSPANIAFIKFWGKKDSKLNLPFNNSISMNLSDCYTITSVEFEQNLKKDKIFVGKQNLKGDKRDRVVRILDLVRKMAHKNVYARVNSKNNFPSEAGIASSASAFSALALAASRSIGLNLPERELSVLARLGSGSASRSINDGFSEWRVGKSSDTSYSFSIANPNFWDLRDLVVITTKAAKKASSTEGHFLATTSPFFKTRQNILKKRTFQLRSALLKKQFKKFGELLEEEAIELHIIAMTSKPAIYYWNQGTVEVMATVRGLRDKGILCYYTVDAGPNVHIICLGNNENKIKQVLSRLSGVIKIISNKACKGARIIE